MTGDVLHITPGEQLTVTTSTPDLLEVEAEWAPGGEHKPPRHLHPAQDEHFAVHAGALTVEMGGETRVVRAGDTIDVPRGTAHRMWSGSDEVTRATWQTRPALRTEEWFRTLDRLHAEAAPKRPSPLALAAALQDFADEMRLDLPGGIDRPVVAMLGQIGKRTGRA